MDTWKVCSANWGNHACAKCFGDVLEEVPGAIEYKLVFHKVFHEVFVEAYYLCYMIQLNEFVGEVLFRGPGMNFRLSQCAMAWRGTPFQCSQKYLPLSGSFPGIWLEKKDKTNRKCADQGPEYSMRECITEKPHNFVCRTQAWHIAQRTPNFPQRWKEK